MQKITILLISKIILVLFLLFIAHVTANLKDNISIWIITIQFLLRILFELEIILIILSILVL